jgi:regulator of nucleoside diphosphate kinase
MTTEHDESRARRSARAAEPPPVYVTPADRQALLQLVGSREGPTGAALLATELERAVLVEPGEAPRRFVRLGSTVRFEHHPSGSVRTLQVVLPSEADIDAGRISVLSPVGAALFGLPVGRRLTWSGGARAVRILAISDV